MATTFDPARERGDSAMPSTGGENAAGPGPRRHAAEGADHWRNADQAVIAQMVKLSRLSEPGSGPEELHVRA